MAVIDSGAALRHEDGDEQQADSYARNNSHLKGGRNLAGNEARREAAHHHQNPVDTCNHTADGCRALEAEVR